MTATQRPEDTGDRTPEELDEELQVAMRRQAATRDPEELPDSTDRMTAAGPGAGQGMEHQRTGQDPDHPAERGEPRGNNPNWPY